MPPVDKSQLEAFEGRASEAEARLSKLEAQLDRLDANLAEGQAHERKVLQATAATTAVASSAHAPPAPAGTSDPVLLEKLKELRVYLGQAEEEQTTLVQQRDEALKESSRLAAENSKLQYRIVHLVRAVREGEEKLEEASRKNAAGA